MHRVVASSAVGIDVGVLATLVGALAAQAGTQFRGPEALFPEGWAPGSLFLRFGSLSGKDVVFVDAGLGAVCGPRIGEK